MAKVYQFWVSYWAYMTPGPRLRMGGTLGGAGRGLTVGSHGQAPRTSQWSVPLHILPRFTHDDHGLGHRPPRWQCHADGSRVPHRRRWCTKSTLTSPVSLLAYSVHHKVMHPPPRPPPRQVERGCPGGLESVGVYATVLEGWWGHGAAASCAFPRGEATTVQQARRDRHASQLRHQELYTCCHS